jgi:hypothetical protein
MAAPTCSESELLKLLQQSGYPFELSVAETLQARGFEVQLSQHYYNPFKQKDSEIDILATYRTTASSKTKPKINLHLELAIECKDNSLPFVLFGFEPPPRPASGFLDMDTRYVKIRSTDDDFPNYLAMVAFGDSKQTPPKDIKSSIHQFDGQFRFHHAACVEVDGSNKFKLHESDKLRSALNGIIGCSEYMQDTWMKHKKVLDNLSHDPTLWITFFLLVHKGKHFRYTNKNKLEAATQTTLFTSAHSDDNFAFIAIDFVEYSGLSAAINKIATSYNHLKAHLAPYLKPSQNPLKMPNSSEA